MIEFTQRGEYSLTVTDKAGNTTTATITLVNAPAIKVMTVAEEGEESVAVTNNGRTSKSVDITTTGVEIKLTGTYDSNEISGIEGNSYRLDNKSGDGVYVFTATDKYSNTATHTFTLDTKIPSAPTLEADETKYTNSSVQITVNYPQAAQSDMVYSIKYTGQPDDYEGNVKNATYEGPITVSANAVVSATYKNDSGLTSETGSITITNIDKKEPTINFGSLDENITVEKADEKISIGGREYELYETSASGISVNITDPADTVNAQSGIANATSAFGETSSDVTDTPYFTITNNETNRSDVYVITATDNAGNTVSKAVRLVEAPTMTAVTVPVKPGEEATDVADNALINRDVKLTLAGTGIKLYEGSVSEENEKTIESDNTYTVSISTGRQQNFTIIVVDKFGNKAQIMFTIDKTLPPAPEVSASPTDYVNTERDGNVIVTVTYPENTVKDGEKYYKIGDEGEATKYTEPFEVSENTTVYAWYINRSGNESSQGILNIENIDNINPTINFRTNDSTVKILEEEGLYSTSANEVIASANDDENGTGLKEFKYTYNDGISIPVENAANISFTERGKYVVTAVDKAGNTVEKTITVVDKPTIATLPTVSQGQKLNNEVKVNVYGSDAKLSLVTNAADIANGEITELPFTASVDGTYSFTVTDKYSNTASLEFIIDTKLGAEPIIAYDPTITNKEGIKVTIEYPEGAKNRTYRVGMTTTPVVFGNSDEDTSFILKENGTVYAWYTTTEGTESAVASKEIKVFDRMAPTLTGISGENGISLSEILDENNDLTGYKTSANKVVISATDDENGTGIDYLAYIKNPTQANDDDDYTKVVDSSLELSSVGKYIVKAYDKVGNVSSLNVEIVEKPVIETSPVIINNQTVNNSVNVSIKNDTEVNKIDIMKLGAEGEYEAVEVENNKNFTLDTEGKDTFKIDVTDNFQAKASITFTIDKTVPDAPVITAVPTTPVGIGDENVVTVTITLPEGVTEGNISYKLGNGEYQEYTDSFTVSENTTVYAKYTTTSEGLTKESAEANYEIANIDKSAPQLSLRSSESTVSIITDENGNAKTSASSVSITATDEGLGLVSVVYSKDGDENIPLTNNSGIISDRGVYVITATDKAGNTDTKTIELVAKPTISTVPNNINNGQIVNKDVTVSKTGEQVTFMINGQQIADSRGRSL